MNDNYFRMFGEKPRHTCSSPLAHGDHPELEETEELDVEGIKKYQSLIGALQWAVTLGRFDISTAVMTMSGFRVAPRTGHLDRVKRIAGYLSKMKDGVIRFRVEEPDLSDVVTTDGDWTYSVCGDVAELIPTNAPEPKGKYVVTVTYVDANLHHDFTSGKAVTGKGDPVTCTNREQSGRHSVDA